MFWPIRKSNEEEKNLLLNINWRLNVCSISPFNFFGRLSRWTIFCILYLRCGNIGLIMDYKQFL